MSLDKENIHNRTIPGHSGLGLVSPGSEDSEIWGARTEPEVKYIVIPETNDYYTEGE